MLRLIFKNGGKRFEDDNLNFGMKVFEIKCEALEKMIAEAQSKDASLTLLGIEIFEPPKVIVPYVPPVMLPAKPQEDLLAELRTKHNKSLTGRLMELMRSKPKPLALP